MVKWIAGLVLVGVLVGGLAAANLRRGGPDAVALDWKLIQAPAREVTLEEPRSGPIVQTITAPGVVELIVEAKIASQLIGRVVKVHIEDGDEVKVGDVLVELDKTDADARLDSAEARIKRLSAAIEQSQTALDKSSRDLERVTRLAARAVVTATELENARSMVEQDQAALVMSQNDLREAEAMRVSSLQELDRTKIRAPISGRVAGLDVEEGEVVIAGTTNLPGTVMMTIGDPGKLRIRADVDETDIPLVRPGQPARIFLLADPSKPLDGKVYRVSTKGEKLQEVVSFETLVSVEGTSEALKPGMTATVEVEVQQAPRALGIPVQAVLQRRRKDLPDTPAIRTWIDRQERIPGEKARDAEARYVKIVFVWENGRARAVPVETGLSDEKRVEILSGLAPTDRVIVGPFRALDELKDGDPVLEAKAPAETSSGASSSATPAEAR
jgi:HlyD family secretion protein